MNTILFDLDGTLLPMDHDPFMKSYFTHLAVHLAPLGFQPKEIIKVIMTGFDAVVENDGTMKNADRFWLAVLPLLGDRAPLFAEAIDEFYDVGYQACKQPMMPHPFMATVIQQLKQKGYQLVVATGPVFYEKAIHHRLRWAGLNPKDFALITTLNTASFGKPNPAYYQEILTQLGKTPQECLMVGNDIYNDMVGAEAIGLSTYLITTHLMPTLVDQKDRYRNGTYEDFFQFIQQLPSVN